MNFAYVARGRLFVKLADESPREIESPFAAQVIRRSAQLQQKNAWKTQGQGARFLFGGVPSELEDPGLPQTDPIHITSVCRGRHEGEIVYTLSTGQVSGLFAFSGGEEERLHHGTDCRLEEVNHGPDAERFVGVVRQKGTAHLGVLGNDGQGLQVVTEGDSFEEAPSFIPGKDKHVVYVARPLGYDRRGQVVDLGDAHICRLDLVKGEITALATEAGADLLAPRMLPDGSLFCLRRPRPKLAPFSLWRAIVDIALFPFRLFWAFVQYLNVFAMRYSGKPLLNAGDAKAKRADAKRALVMRNVAAAGGSATDDEATIPSSWVLQRRLGERTEELAKGVLAYDVWGEDSARATLLCTDGTSIWQQPAGGKKRELCRDEGISAVVVLAPSTAATVDEAGDSAPLTSGSSVGG
jgi:hypothetical protein